MPNVKIKRYFFLNLLNTFIQISDMFHPNTDVKANLKLLTVTELRSILQARMQTFEKGVCVCVGGGVVGTKGVCVCLGGSWVRIYMFYLNMLHCFPYYLKQ